MFCAHLFPWEVAGGARLAGRCSGATSAPCFSLLVLFYFWNALLTLDGESWRVCAELPALGRNLFHCNPLLLVSHTEATVRGALIAFGVYVYHSLQDWIYFFPPNH